MQLSMRDEQSHTNEIVATSGHETIVATQLASLAHASWEPPQFWSAVYLQFT